MTKDNHKIEYEIPDEPDFIKFDLVIDWLGKICLGLGIFVFGLNIVRYFL